ncbi:MAG: cell division protein FtsQ/DivIB [Candidatus Paceibacterota bacterium]
MRSKSVLDTPRLRELRKQKRDIIKRRAWIGLGVCVVLFVGLGFLARIKEVNIQEVSVTGNKIVDKEALEKFTWDVLREYYLWLYPKSNAMIYPTRELERRILENFKRIEKVDFSINTERALNLMITERGVKYVWCDVSMRCYFADIYGYVFDEAPYFSGPVYIKFYGGIDESLPVAGQTVFGGKFADLASFVESIKNLGVEVVGVRIKNENEIEIELPQYGDESAKIIFNPIHDLYRTLENLKTALESEPLVTDMATRKQDLLYIDLRFGNKVYFKFK